MLNDKIYVEKILNDKKKCW